MIIVTTITIILIIDNDNNDDDDNNYTNNGDNHHNNDNNSKNYSSNRGTLYFIFCSLFLVRISIHSYCVCFFFLVSHTDSPRVNHMSLHAHGRQLSTDSIDVASNTSSSANRCILCAGEHSTLHCTAPVFDKNTIYVFVLLLFIYVFISMLVNIQFDILIFVDA